MIIIYLIIFFSNFKNYFELVFYKKNHEIILEKKYYLTVSINR